MVGFIRKSWQRRLKLLGLYLVTVGLEANNAPGLRNITRAGTVAHSREAASIRQVLTSLCEWCSVSLEWQLPA